MELEQRNPNALTLGYVLRGTKAYYRIGNVLGTGGFGITYLALDVQAHRRVAVKELFPMNKMSRNRDGSVAINQTEMIPFFQHVKKRFYGEAKLLYDLRTHSEILNLFDYFEANGTAYYVMEYLEGQSLAQMLHRQECALTWQQLKMPTSQVLNTLSILHAHGLLHRDISPDNIILCANGVAKLIDFGSVRPQEAKQFTTWVKERFSAPEMYFAEDMEKPCTDLYSVCATLYYLLSGGKAPAKASERSVRQKPLVPLGEYAPDVPAYVQEAIHKGLNLSMGARFQTVSELQEALRLRPQRSDRQASGAAGETEKTVPATSHDTGETKEQAKGVWVSFQKHLQHKKPARTGMLVCVKGYFLGKQYALVPEVEVSLGREAISYNSTKRPDILYPNNGVYSQGISRSHCVFRMDTKGNCYIKDLRSTYGTFVDDVKIDSQIWFKVRPGQRVSVGREEYVFVNGR